MVSSEKYQVDCFSPLSYRLPGRSIPPSLGSKAARLSQLFENAKVCLGFFCHGGVCSSSRPPVGAGSPASWLKIPTACQLFLPTTHQPLNRPSPPSLDRKEGQCVLLVPKKHSCKGIALRCKVVLQLVGSGRSFGRLVGLVGGPAMASCCNAVVLPSSGSAEVGEDTDQHRRRSRQSNFSAAAPLQEAPVREPRKRSHSPTSCCQ